MAKRYVLVPPSWLETSKAKEIKQVPMTVETILENEHEQDLSALFPKRLQSKAKLMLSYLKNVKQDSNNRVLYADGSAGSTLYDIVRYLITDSGQFSAPRPIDSDQFKREYCVGVPTAAYGKGKEYNKGKLEWKRLY